jgi:proline dehydrogenase
MYRKDRLEYLESLHQRAVQEDFKIGVKLVRGAYMEKERNRAKENGYSDPICNDKTSTDHQFNSAMSYALDHIEQISLFAGTHNEESCMLLLTLMEEKNIENNDPNIWFGQLYGMSDHISYNLSFENYNVTKYLPYGPVREVMPYLIRRAEENTSVAGQTHRELELIRKEISQRKTVQSD